jgi:hypothetical protein
MKIESKLAAFVLLAGSISGIGQAQQQNELSSLVKSNLRPFVTSLTYSYVGDSSMARIYLSSAMQNAMTVQDFKELMVASRILYCQKVLEDLSYSTPNYSQVKSDFELELKNDLTSLKKATE